MTNTAKHTPGPWHFTIESAQWHYIHSYKNGIVAEVRKRSNTNEEGEANARLIAAAPEMYEIISAMVNAFDGGISCNFQPDCAMAGKMRSVTYKVEGK